MGPLLCAQKQKHPPCHIRRRSVVLCPERKHMRGAILWLIALAMMVNGGAMLLAPARWYWLVPGVAGTGPLNPHFVRDIGAAYLVAGAGIVWFLRDRRARAAAMLAAAFLLAHALIHVADAIAGREGLAQLLVDAPAVLLPGPPCSSCCRRKPHDQMADAAAACRLRTELRL
jgi:uncharacterized protein YjeT (DUF2065 family)